MFKSVAATALAATIALTSLAPAPAHAGDDDLGRFILGASLLAILAATIDERNDNDSSDRSHSYYPKREVHHHYRTPPRTHRKDPTPHKPRVIRREVQPHKVVPRRCEVRARVDGGYKSFFLRPCLESRGIRTGALPNQCERVLNMPGKRENRRGWHRGCLERSGYRIR